MSDDDERRQQYEEEEQRWQKELLDAEDIGEERGRAETLDAVAKWMRKRGGFASLAVLADEMLEAFKAQ